MPCATIPEPGPQEIQTESGLRNLSWSCGLCLLQGSQTSCFAPFMELLPSLSFHFQSCLQGCIPSKAVDVDGSTKPGAGSGSGTCSAPSQPLPGMCPVPGTDPGSEAQTGQTRRSHGIPAAGSLQLPKLFETWQLQRMGLTPSFPWCPVGMSLVLWAWIHPNPVLPIQLKNSLLCYL